MPPEPKPKPASKPELESKPELATLVSVAPKRRRGPKPLVPYTIMYAASILVAVTSAVLGAASGQVETLMLGPQGLAWIVVVMAGLNIAAGLLPSVRKPPSPDREGLD